MVSGMRRLRALLMEQNLTIQALAKRAGFRQSTLYRKIQGNGLGFTVREIQRIRTTLGLTDEQVTQFFLY